MSSWDEAAFREINDIDAARLALRGALSTIRDLQAITTKIKEEGQEQANLRRAAEARALELSAALERWQQQAQDWEKERLARAADEAQFRNNVRLEVRAEESQRLEEERRSLEGDLARLRAQLEELVRSHKDKEEEWGRLGRRLQAQELELVAAQREKVEIAERFRHDAQLLERMREERDREIAAGLAERDRELRSQQAEIERLRRQDAELKKAAETSSTEFEKRIHEKEESLLRDFRIKEQALQERYNKREADLQNSWSELESGLWQRTREGREKLDLAVNAQFEEKARALADRSKEFEAFVAARKKELEDEHALKSSQLEERHAQAERRMLEQWTEKEKRFLHKFEFELANEKKSLNEQYDKRARILEADYNAKFAELERRADDQQSEHKHALERAAEDAARKDILRRREQDDELARKTAELEAARQADVSLLSDKELKLREELGEEFNRLRAELYEKQNRVLEHEKALMRAELEERSRALEGSYQVKVAELERGRQTLDAQFLQWKLAAQSDFAQKEKNLDARWSVREQELLRAHEAALEQQRRTFHLEAQKAHERFEDQRQRAEAAALERERKNLENFQKMERDLRDVWGKHEGELLKRQETELAGVREDYEQRLRLEAEHAEKVSAIARAELLKKLNIAREQHGAAAAQLQRKLLEKEAEIEELARTSSASVEQARQEAARLDSKCAELWKDLQARQGQWEAERMRLEENIREREIQREKKYIDLESAMHARWTLKEAEYLGAHRQALQQRHEQHLKDLAERDASNREAFEQWKKEAQVELEKRAQDRKEALAVQERRLSKLKEELALAPTAGESGSTPGDLASLIASALPPLDEIVSGIAGASAQRLRGRLLAPGERKSLEGIERSAQNLRAHLDRIKLLARQPHPILFRTSASELLNDLAAKLAARAHALGVDVVVKNEADAPNLQADGVMLLEALLELADNALEAMPRGGKLLLASRWDQARAEALIEIEDSGPGFNPSPDFGRPFFTTKNGRLGLGAAIARKILLAHHGAVEWDSRYGRGCRALCRLPA